MKWSDSAALMIQVKDYSARCEKLKRQPATERSDPFEAGRLSLGMDHGQGRQQERTAIFVAR